MAKTTKAERKTSDHPGGEVIHDGKLESNKNWG